MPDADWCSDFLGCPCRHPVRLFRYTVSGVGWYRKTFESPGSSAAGRTVIRFDGVYMHADVYVNEVLVGSHPYG